MAKYTMSGNAGAASVTAATAGLGKVEEGATTTVSKILGFVVGPQASSADNTYGIRLKRQSTSGTFTGSTPSPTDANMRASACSGGTAGTSAGTAGVELWRGGFHMRAGIQIVPIPGAEWMVTPTTCNSVLLEYIFTQSTDVNSVAFTFEE